MKCEDCKFFDHQPSKFMSGGYCRFHAPVTGVNSDGYTIEPWPNVGANDFCSEFKQKQYPRTGGVGKL